MPQTEKRASSLCRCVGFALTKNRRGGFWSQNDVKFVHTYAAKGLIQLFQKLAGFGAEPHIVLSQNSL